MRIAVGQINTTVGDMRGNVRKIVAFAQQAAYKGGAELIVFPELAICAYPPRDLVQVDGFQRENHKSLLELSRQLPAGLTAIAGYVSRSPQSNGKPFANAGAVLGGGKLFYCQAKILLPTYDVFDDHHNFEPGGHSEVFRVGKPKLASPFVKTAGTINIFGRDDCTRAIRWKN